MLIVRVVKFIVFALAWCWRGAGGYAGYTGMYVVWDMEDLEME
jgi:hypothetical protein